MSVSLQQKNTRTLLTWLPMVLLGCSVLFYFLMRGHVFHMREQQLELKQANVWDAFRSGGIPLHINGEYDIEKGGSLPSMLVGRQRDTTLPYGNTGDRGAFAILTRQYRLGGVPYQVTTYFSSREITHLLIKVSVAEAIIFLLLLTAIVIINRRTSRLIWTPFYDTLKRIREYDIRKNMPIDAAAQTGIDEFDRLNQVLASLIEHVKKAYDNQKQFTENASHELQTPSAIIRSKVELLMNAPTLTEEMAGWLGDINEVNERLSQMNKNLLLLAKIDNLQFPETHSISVSRLVERSIAQFREYKEGEHPEIEACLDSRVRVQANSSLMEILVHNLLRNAIVHNVPGGWVRVRLAGDELDIENSGPVLEGEPQRLFERFEKGQEGSGTTGLGLALVKQICQLYRFDIRYFYEGGSHRIRVRFA